MHGAEFEALAVAAVVLPVVGLMAVVSLGSECGQVCLLELLEGQVVLALDSLELLQGPRQLWRHVPRCMPLGCIQYDCK